MLNLPAGRFFRSGKVALFHGDPDPTAVGDG